LADAPTVIGATLADSADVIGWSISTTSDFHTSAMRPYAGGSPSERVVLNLHVQELPIDEAIGVFPTLPQVLSVGDTDCSSCRAKGLTVNGGNYIWWGDRFDGQSLNNQQFIGYYQWKHTSLGL